MYVMSSFTIKCIVVSKGKTKGSSPFRSVRVVDRMHIYCILLLYIFSYTFQRYMALDLRSQLLESKYDNMSWVSKSSGTFKLNNINSR